MSSGPALSLVFVATEEDATVRSTLASLSAQTIRHSIELLIVAQDPTRVGIDEGTAREFHSTRVVACGSEALLGRALAIGVRQATAPIVALIEDHCAPEPAWAETLLARHAEGHAVVGSEIRNANPGSSLSWANFVLTHADWACPARAGIVDVVAGDNCSYRRDVLLAIGPELDELLGSGSVLQRQLRAAGETVFLEPKAKLVHITPSRLDSFVGSFFYSGRLYAALASRRWTLRSRWIMAAAAPLIMSRWVWDRVRRVRHVAPGTHTRRIQLLMLLAVPVSSIGAMLGYLLGPGRSATYTSDIYFHRNRHLARPDRDTFAVTRAGQE